MNLHLTLQGKGGVGKTLVTTMIAQYLTYQDKIPTCIDTDPVNRSFTAFQSLNVTPLDIMDGDNVNNRKFDELIKIILESKEDIIIDNGASSFIPVTAYLKENDVFQLLVQNNITVFFHVVITGGQSFIDTIKGLEYIIQTFSDFVNVVIWLNPFFGKIEQKGKTFEDMNIFKKNKSNIYGIVTIPDKTKETFGDDVKQMLEDRKTFEEYIESDDYFIMPRQRIRIFRDEIFNNISMVLQK